MQQWWFDDGLGLKSVTYGVFLRFPPHFKVFIKGIGLQIISLISEESGWGD